MVALYGLGGQGIEPLSGRDFPDPFITALWPTQPPMQWASGNSQGYSKRDVALSTHPSTSTEGKECSRVKVTITFLLMLNSEA